MKVTDLVKVFSTPVGPKTAVNKLNVTMYEGQIFVLLGHNGISIASHSFVRCW